MGVVLALTNDTEGSTPCCILTTHQPDLRPCFRPNQDCTDSVSCDVRCVVANIPIRSHTRLGEPSLSARDYAQPQPAC